MIIVWPGFGPTFFAVHSDVTRVGNCDIRAYENISVFNETKQNEISLKPKVFVQIFFHFWLPDFDKLVDKICPTFALFT